MTLCHIDDSLHCSRCGRRVSAKDVKAICEGVAKRHLHAVVGPGSELSKLLQSFGIEATPTCTCRAKAAEMDAWGCDECSKRERIEEVVGVMRGEANARGLPFLDAAARLLVRRAIANARKAEARRAKEAEAAAAKGPAA